MKPDSAGPGAPAVARTLEHPLVQAALIGVVVAFTLLVSWNRWCDPIVDFGRELYIPWRLTEGAVLYREVEDYYGPLSHYANALLFHLFGPGLRVLVVANLVIYLAIVALLVALLRKSWGPRAALAGGLVFVAVFGVARYTDTGNFNYLTPYAHETTHGMLVLLLLLAVLGRWLERPGAGGAFLAGLLFGVTLLLKPEIILAAGVAGSVAWLLRRAAGGRLTGAELAAGIAGALLPTAAFAGFFARHFAPGEAVLAAGRAWANAIFHRDLVASPAQRVYAGLDAPWLHLWEHLRGAALGYALVGGLFFAGVMLGRVRRPAARAALAAFVVAAAAVAAWRLNWIECGRSLLGLVAGLLVWEVRAVRAAASDPVARPAAGRRLLLAAVAAALLLRMILNGRVYQYGYYQAALAGVVVTAFLVGGLPGRFAAPWPRRTLLAAALVLLTAGTAELMRHSYFFTRTVLVPVGQGRDFFYAPHPKILPASLPLAWAVQQLQARPAGETLLALPEGLMVNYLARMPSPLPHIFYYSAVTENGREPAVVEALRRRPPDWVVLTPRLLVEYGITRYGERSGAGRELLSWVRENYVPVGTVHGRPMTFEQDGFAIYQRRPPAVPAE